MNVQTAGAKGTLRDETQVVRRTASLPLFPALFLVALLIPVFFSIGPARLNAYRAIILLSFIPAIAAWLGGRAGPVRGFDILILFASLWAAGILFLHHPASQALEPAGIVVLETFGPYLISRIFVRSAEEFAALCRLFFWLVVLLLPFAAYEAMTDRAILIELAGRFGPTFIDNAQEQRMGLYRAQVVFEHSILYGAFVAAVLGPVHYVINPQLTWMGRGVTYSVTFAATVFSVSAGALLSLAMQIGTITWHFATRSLRRPWTLLACLFIGAYLVVDLLSNRTPAHVFATHFAFSYFTAYARIQIFNWGLKNIGDNPWFGIGMNDWERESWMGNSVDNFWLLIAMRYGLPCFFLFVGGVIWILNRVSFAELGARAAREGRAAYLTSMGGLIVAGLTVHYWNASYVFFMFFLGMGVWATTPDSVPADDDTAKLSRRQGPTHQFQRSRSGPRTEPATPGDDDEITAPLTPYTRQTRAHHRKPPKSPD